MLAEGVLAILEALTWASPYSLQLTISYDDPTAIIQVNQDVLADVSRRGNMLAGYSLIDMNTPPDGCANAVTIARQDGELPGPDTLLDMDLTTVPTIYIGLEFVGFQRWQWSNPGPWGNDTTLPAPYIREALAAYRPVLQHVAAMWRQLGVRLRVAHVHFQLDDNMVTRQYIWDTLRPQLRHEVQGALIVAPSTDHPYADGGSCTLSFGYATVPYDFRDDPSSPQAHYSATRDVAHELGHDMLGLGHAFDYTVNGVPFEGDACPPYDSMSVMGYQVWNCYEPWAPSWTGALPPLRYDAYEGPLWRKARQQILRKTALCLPVSSASQNLGTLPTSGDTDGDEMFNADDNCPAVANSNQANRDGDQFGDWCDSCAIVRPARTAWALLLPPLVLAWRRRRP